ncbi:MAG: PQQ-dependent sugar dehydrogenase [Thermomicrobiales bacterium]|nr:PQQ-dependent sugar dehydrogenase [Thermomicrobiales bacterium]
MEIVAGKMVWLVKALARSIGLGVMLWSALVPALAPRSAVSAQSATPLPDVAPGFVDTPLRTVYGSPTDLAWLEDDLLIATQEGWLFRLERGSPTATPTMILDLSRSIGTGQEQGLLGVIPDPDYPARPYIYVYYTQDRGTGHCAVAPVNCRNRVSRFTMGADGLLDPASERVLLDTIMVGSLHNAGDLAFDVDGLLYVTVGDAGYWPNAQDLANLNGKILRLDRDGLPAAGNPFATEGAIPCQQEPRRLAMEPCPEIFAWGLRNPFRITFDPNGTGSEFYINDVGQESWEEIDVGRLGANYGWPEREGPCRTAQLQGCHAPGVIAEPIYTYSHETGCFAITGGAFVPAESSWGSDYRGKYLFADWGCGKIFVLDRNEDGAYEAVPFASGLSTIAPILFSRDGDALIYGREGGVVRMIRRGVPEATPVESPLEADA